MLTKTFGWLVGAVVSIVNFAYVSENRLEVVSQDSATVSQCLSPLQWALEALQGQCFKVPLTSIDAYLKY